MISWGILSFNACLVKYGAKDGVNGNSDWYHATKVHLLHLSIILDDLLTLNFNIHAYVPNFTPNFMHICRGSKSFQNWACYDCPILSHEHNSLDKHDKFTKFYCKTFFVMGCHQLPKRGWLKISSLVLIIDVTLGLTLCLSVYLAKGNPSHGWSQVIKKRWMVDPQVMIKCSSWKRTKRKAIWAQGKGIDHRAISFCNQDTIEGVSDLGSIIAL